MANGPSGPPITVNSGNLKITYGFQAATTPGYYPFMLVVQGTAVLNGFQIYDDIGVFKGVATLTMTGGQVRFNPCGSITPVRYKQIVNRILPGYVQAGGSPSDTPSTLYQEYDLTFTPTANLVQGCAVAQLTSIGISPLSSSVPQGQPVTFSATGNLSNGTTQNISGNVTWASSNPAVATVSATGVASTLTQGSTTITASMNGIVSNSVSLTVNPPALATLSITPISGSSIVGYTQQLTATGTMSNGSTATLGALTWSSSNPAVANVNASGLVTSVGPGSTNISASSSGITSNIAVLTFNPAAPFGVMAVSGTNQMTISWSPAAGATSYNIYWGTAPGITSVSTKITNVAPPYVQTGLTQGSTYCYRVSAVTSVSQTFSTETCSYVYTGGNPSGLFSATGSMPVARSNHTSTLLLNGTVLIAGGQWLNAALNAYQVLASATIYNPTAGSFSISGNMTTPRISHTATLLPNGKVLIAGGTGTNILASAELYDPATGVFNAAGTMTTPRTGHTATLLPNGKVLVTGGQIGVTTIGPVATVPVNTASAELYDPATGLWTATGSMAVARAAHTATLLPNGNVLIAGGGGTAAELYNPVTGLFSTTGTGGGGIATLLPNNKVLFVSSAGGQLYDPVTGLFSATGSMVTPRNFSTSTLLPNGKVLIAGGVDVNLVPLASAELYDPVTGLFSATGSMSTGRTGDAATLLPNGAVLISGGSNAAGLLATAELFK